MEKYLPIMQISPIFSGIEKQDLIPMLSCLSSYRKEFRKGEFLVRMGEPVRAAGLVLEGRIHIIKEDFWGSSTILSQAGPGELFGESYACIFPSESSVSVVAQENTTILFLDVGKVIQVCSSACGFHIRIIQNLLTILAQKNRILTEKIGYLSKRSTREKLISYLSDQSVHSKSVEFTIPFNRQQLADYLACDRSALSGELGKMRKEGILEFRKNKFILKRTFS